MSIAPLKRVQQVADRRLREVAGKPVNRGPVFLDKRAQILRGLELLAEKKAIVAIEHVTIAGDERDLRLHSDQVGRTCAARRVIGERRDIFAQNRSVQNGVTLVRVGRVHNPVARARIQLVNYRIGEDHLCAVLLDSRRKHRYGERPDVSRDVARTTGYVIAAAQTEQHQESRGSDGSAQLHSIIIADLHAARAPCPFSVCL